MMPRIATVMITVLCLTPALVTAQEPQCNNIPFPGATTACNTAVDAVRAFYPLAGMIVSGGKPVLGTARTLGGLGHVALTALGTAPGTGDDFEFTMDLKSDSYRAVAGWRFVLVDVAAGIGIDRYKSTDTNIRFYDSPTNIRTVVINPTNTRALVFVNGGLSLAAVKLVGEIGLQAGKDQAFATSFSGFDPKAAHAFGGIGIRFGF